MFLEEESKIRLGLDIADDRAKGIIAQGKLFWMNWCRQDPSMMLDTKNNADMLKRMENQMMGDGLK